MTDLERRRKQWEAMRKTVEAGNKERAAARVPTTNVNDHTPAMGFGDQKTDIWAQQGIPTAPVQNVYNPHIDTAKGTGTDPRGVYDTTGRFVDATTTGKTPTANVTKDVKKDAETEKKVDLLEKEVDDIAKLEKSLGEEYGFPVNQDDIRQALGDVREAIDQFGQPYNLGEDEIFQNIADHTKRQMMTDAGRRGLEFSDNTKARISQAQSLLGLDFQQAHDARNLQGIQNQQQYLNNVMGMHQQNYGMHRDAIGDARYADEMAYNRQMDTRNMEIQDYGFELTDNARGLMDTFQNLAPEQREYAMQFDGNYAERMNQLDPNSEEYQMLDSARFAKVLREFANNPQEMGQYLINDYGINPTQVTQMKLQHQDANLQKELQTIQQYYPDFQQEINNRMAQNPNDPLIPFLHIARAEKIASIQEGEMQAAEKLQKEALDMFKLLGVANGFIAEVLGLPDGAMTADFYDKNGRLAISEAELGIKQGHLNIAGAKLSLAQQKAQRALQGVSEEAQVFYGQFLKDRVDNPDLTLDQFLNSTMGYETDHIPIGPMPAGYTHPDPIPIRYIESMSFQELEDFAKVAKAMGHMDSKSETVQLFEIMFGEDGSEALDRIEKELEGVK